MGDTLADLVLTRYRDLVVGSRARVGHRGLGRGHRLPRILAHVDAGGPSHGDRWPRVLRFAGRPTGGARWARSLFDGLLPPVIIEGYRRAD